MPVLAVAAAAVAAVVQAWATAWWAVAVAEAAEVALRQARHAASSWAALGLLLLVGLQVLLPLVI